MEMSSMLIMMPLVYVSRSIDWNDERVLLARIAFGVVQAAILVVLLIVRSKIKAAAVQTKIQVPLPKKTPWGQSEGEEEMTIEEYEMKEWSAIFMQGTLMQIAIIGFISYKFETVIPLISQVIMGPMKIFNHNLVKIHLRGEQVEHPFPLPKSPFEDLFGGNQDDPIKKKKKKKD